MKWIIYFLVLVNLAFFAWNYQAMPWRRQAAAVDASAESGDDVARLRLLDEPASTPKKRAHTTVAGSRHDKTQCATVGPFEERSQAAGAVRHLRGMDIRSHVRVEHLPDKNGYWVLIPPAKSRATAHELIANLRAKGVKDYFLVATGDTKNAISLGVFSSKAAAQQRISDVHALGFSPKIQSVSLPQRRYWLDFDADVQPEEVEEGLATLLGDYPHLERSRRTCEPD